MKEPVERPRQRCHEIARIATGRAFGLVTPGGLLRRLAHGTTLAPVRTMTRIGSCWSLRRLALAPVVDVEMAAEVRPRQLPRLRARLIERVEQVSAY